MQILPALPVGEAPDQSLPGKLDLLIEADNIERDGTIIGGHGEAASIGRESELDDRPAGAADRRDLASAAQIPDLHIATIVADGQEPAVGAECERPDRTGSCGEDADPLAVRRT